MNYLDDVFMDSDFDSSKSLSIGLASRTKIQALFEGRVEKTIRISKIIGIDETLLVTKNVINLYKLHNNVYVVETDNEYIICMIINSNGNFKELMNEPKCAIIGCTNEMPIADSSVNIGLYDYKTKLNSKGVYPCVKSYVVPEKVLQLSDNIAFLKSPLARYYVYVNA